ncbi:TPA: hypothetical protein SMF28_000425 [Serratia marcescens]|nr:hypothetical protein [Serratia marcescens]HEJ9034465.1 hypothetical protein [Serratia marcescens]HEJ9090815.1 hypothetical protein [Serratia marcescens]
MSTEKLSELSKPVMYIVRTLDGSVASVKSHSYTAPKGFTSEPLYSQEYVSALDGVSQFWIGESAGWKKRAEDAEKRIAELEAKLATPVRLPDALIPAVHASGEPFMRPEPFGFYLNRDDVIKKLRAAGFTVEGDSE